MTRKAEKAPKTWIDDAYDPVSADFSITRDGEFTKLFLFRGEIKLFVFDDDDDDGEPEPKQIVDDDGFVRVGQVRGTYVPLLDDVEELIEMADSIADEDYDLVQLPWVNKELVIKGFSDDMPLSAWLGVHAVVIEPAFRGKGLGYFAMREVIRLFSTRLDVLVTLKPHPIMTEETRKFSEKQIAAAQMKLRRYWRSFGFRRIGKSDIFGHDSRLLWPAKSWMAKHDK